MLFDDCGPRAWDCFDEDDSDALEGITPLASDTVEDLADVLAWRHEVLRPWEQPRKSVVKREDLSVLARRERRSRKDSTK